MQEATYTKQQPESVQQLFNRVAQNYDVTNIALSMGLCSLWMRKMGKELSGYSKLGDLCAGTGAVSKLFLKQNPKGQASLYDFSPNMLEIAKKRLAPYQKRYTLTCGDCHKLPYTNESFDALSMAYGLRNLKEPLTALQECRRVLEPGGKLVILELTRPKSRLLFALHKFYLRLFVPLIGSFLTSDRKAYCYLAKTVAGFSPPSEINQLLEISGFREITATSLSFGIATLFTASK